MGLGISPTIPLARGPAHQRAGAYYAAQFSPYAGQQLVKSPGNGFFTFSTASWLPRWPPRAGHLHAFSTAFVVVSPLSLFVPAAWWCRSGRCRAGNTATLPAGSRCGGVMVKRRSTHRVLKQHLKICGNRTSDREKVCDGG